PVRLAVEVVSSSSIKRDYEEKPLEYANKGIPEYWIVDPIENKVTVLLLERGTYQEREFTAFEQIVSRTFPELNLTVEQMLSV
ncbi:MAG: Uma2 family endonuclease, partial [Xenococcaceae cyanobacterium]